MALYKCSSSQFSFVKCSNSNHFQQNAVSCANSARLVVCLVINYNTGLKQRVRRCNEEHLFIDFVLKIKEFIARFRKTQYIWKNLFAIQEQTAPSISYHATQGTLAAVILCSIYGEI